MKRGADHKYAVFKLWCTRLLTERFAWPREGPDSQQSLNDHRYLWDFVRSLLSGPEKDLQWQNDNVRTKLDTLIEGSGENGDMARLIWTKLEKETEWCKQRPGGSQGCMVGEHLIDAISHPRASDRFSAEEVKTLNNFRRRQGSQERNF